MDSSGQIWTIVGTIVAALIAAITAFTLNLRDRRAARNKDALEQKRTIYAESFAAVSARHQALIGLSRAYDATETRNHRNSRSRPDRLGQYWDKYRETRIAHSGGNPRLRLLGKKDINDALTQVIADMVVAELTYAAISGQIDPTDTLGADLRLAQKAMCHLEDKAMPALLRAMRLDLEINPAEQELTIRQAIERAGLHPAPANPTGVAAGERDSRRRIDPPGENREHRRHLAGRCLRRRLLEAIHDR